MSLWKQSISISRDLAGKTIGPKINNEMLDFELLDPQRGETK